MTLKDWLASVAIMLSLLGTTAAAGGWMLDQIYVRQESLKSIQIETLDREITFLKIKKEQGEASKSEAIYLETLMQQKRALEQ